MDEKLSMKEFVTYSSPRYYRLIFPKLKPKTKNGDLLSALAELKRSRFITEVNWDKIHLTKKGEIYYKIIQKLLSSQYLNVPQKNKILDYRSETGRSVILQLIRFLSAKLDFNRYFRYLQIPVFKEEENEWLEIFERINLKEAKMKIKVKAWDKISSQMIDVKVLDLFKGKVGLGRNEYDGITWRNIEDVELIIKIIGNVGGNDAK